MTSEESYNPYHPLQQPTTAYWPQDTISSTATKYPLVSQKCRPWALLIVPALMILTITALFCLMLLWLLYHHVNFDPSFASMTNNALIVDEAAQWCWLLSVVHYADCDSNQAPSLLGLTLSGILVSHVIRMAAGQQISDWTSPGALLVEQGRIL